MMDRLWSLVSLSILTPFFLFIPGVVGAEDKIVIGGVEDVILLPWGVKLPARIDTGAAKSSLDARELKVQGDRVEFKLPQTYGGLQLRLPIIEWRHIRTPEGRERRPIVELEICLGSRRIRTLVNLADRSMVKYPLILGRNFLKEKFVVDVKRRRTAKPNCPEIP
ncbi:MAG: ATP-dependent zinc protease [bacterium]